MLKYTLPDHLQVEYTERNLVLPITFQILVCKWNSKIIGIQSVVSDLDYNHEIGIFFLVDKQKWPKQAAADLEIEPKKGKVESYEADTSFF